MATQVILLMGVSGSGKSTVGRALSATLGWPFYDGDEFHPPANVQKMGQGIPLTDADRLPWLQALHDLMADCLAQDKAAIIACSALKQAYRDILLDGNEGVQLVYLRGDYDLILSRMQARGNHFFKPELLASQFTALEEPGSCLTVDIARPIDEIISVIVQRMGREIRN
jgi:gluconokinase